MFSAARKQVAITEHQQRGEGARIDDRRRAAGRVIDTIEEGLGAKHEGLTRAHGDGRGHAALEIKETGTDVEPTQEPVHSSLAGLKAQPGIISDSIDAEGIGECEEVEAGTEIDSARKRSGDLDAHPEGAGPEADSIGAEWPEFLEYGWRALGGNRANICAFCRFSRRGGGCWCGVRYEGEVARQGQVDWCGFYEAVRLEFQDSGGVRGG